MTGVRKNTRTRTRSRLSRVNPETVHDISNTLLCYKAATLCNPRTWVSVLEWKAFFGIPRRTSRDPAPKLRCVARGTGCRILSQN
ncbi:hypothetical protein DID96_09060 [Burkholderia sp. Bp8963]|nr:hypothetical protein DID96_09060 [Burkholderia sp. Bp8963]